MRITLAEDPRHVRLVSKIASIFAISGFETDRKVHVKYDGHETDLDVAAFFQEVLIMVECKSGTDIHPGALLNDLRIKRDDIAQAVHGNKLQVLGSADQKATAEKLKDVRTFKMVIAFERYAPSPDMIRTARQEGVEILDGDAIEYFRRTSKALQSWTKYEMFKEFGIQRDEENDLTEVHALRLKQPGAELYIFSLPPHKLLRIAYVCRRDLKHTDAYQRLITESRVNRIGDFLKSSRAILPNAILLAFDEHVSRRLQFIPSVGEKEGDGEHGKLILPLWYCSSWIIDGQHRLYGFTRTSFSEKPSETATLPPKFELLVVGLKDTSRQVQAQTFVDINDNQKRISPTLLLDLAAEVQDLTQPLTWPSLLVKQLNGIEPWKDRIRVYGVERNKPITLAGFAKWALANELLKYKMVEKKREYTGPLFKFSPFDYTKDVGDEMNKRSLGMQLELLERFFKGLQKSVNASGDKWNDYKRYGVTKATCVNASLLVLNKILEKKPKADFNLSAYLKPVAGLSFENTWVRRFGGGWVGFRGLANEMIDALNSQNMNLVLTKYE